MGWLKNLLMKSHLDYLFRFLPGRNPAPLVDRVLSSFYQERAAAYSFCGLHRAIRGHRDSYSDRAFDIHFFSKVRVVWHCSAEDGAAGINVGILGTSALGRQDSAEQNADRSV